MIAIEEAIKKSEDVFNQELVTEAREDYNQVYEEEIELNEAFNQFVLNYKAAYEGRNTRKAQVIAMNTSKMCLDDKGIGEKDHI